MSWGLFLFITTTVNVFALMYLLEILYKEKEEDEETPKEYYKTSAIDYPNKYAQYSAKQIVNMNRDLLEEV